ncbi:AAA family ATPase [Anaerococcus ihuae]|uniref:AAA family ATPase n=1 Tax=Anaerococcus ihuae TaxID=2899519 RepID=UPI001F231F14|nr:SbcC/MukB-like Walker B domain-containing protein [Anaerococcus ihuae]
MKPVKLEMYGFMTYKNKTFIDFTKLYDSKIFIISGDTGSGKTSIFDAISFALFGKIQRQGFDLNDLRSDFLSGEDPISYVDFSFEIDGKNYRIKRIPSQKAKKTRANVNVSHSVELYKIENDREILISDKVNECEKEIINIIGLDFNQLNRVMILAQGEFSKFLKSSSDKKAELLSKIFSSFIYKNIEEKLKEASKDSKKNLENISKSLESEITKNNLLSENIDSQLIELKNFEEIFKIIEKINDELEKNIDKENKEKLSLEKNLEEENSRLNFYQKENEEIKNYKYLNEKRLELLEDEAYFKNLKKDLFFAEKSIQFKPYYQSLLDLKNSQKDFENKLSNQKEKLSKIEKDLEENLKNLGNREESQKIISEKKESIVKNQSVLDKFINLENLKRDLDKNKKDFQDGKTYKNQIEDFKNKKDMIDKKIREKSNDLLDLSFKLEKINEDKHKISQKVFEYENIYEKSLLNDKKIKDLSKLKIELEESNKDFEISKNLLERAELNKKALLINDFRKDLNENGICPVCGRIFEGEIEYLDSSQIDGDRAREDYLNLKIKIDFLMEKIRDLEKSIDENLERSDHIKKNLDEYKNKLENLKISYEDLYDEFENEKRSKDDYEKKSFAFEKSIENLKNKLQKLENLDDIENLENKYKIKKEEVDNFDKKDIEISIKNDRDFVKKEEERIKNLDDNIKNLEKEKSSLNSLIESYRSYIEDTKDKISKNEKLLDERISENFKNFDEFLKYLEISKKLLDKKDQIEDYFENLNNLSIRLSSLEKYKDKEEYQTENIKEKIEKIKIDLEKINDFLFSLKIKKTRLEESKDQIILIQKELSKSKNDDAILYKLSKIADGSMSKVSGREKLNFETFVLSYYFKKILKFANIRLREMTDGQFTMIRKTQTSDKRKNYGLDIEILDANTGKIRSEASLSGGESFIASLALALGLSDEISGENGGIKIDTLFIDEGFGTLSDDYLEKAIRTIEKLSYDNKFIGLISHVKELKDAIDAKIEVLYSKTQGSSLKVVV